MMTDKYRKQVKLLLRILPYFMRKEQFALKGGTAINLFYQNMPRLSVDIDLTYLHLQKRDSSFVEIDKIFNNVSNELKVRFPTLRLQPVKTKVGNIKQIIFREFDSAVKVEINHVLRGTLMECQMLNLCSTAEEEFGSFVRAPCLSREDLYAGKICAALDRQHPRDLFDIKIFLEKDALDEGLRKSFIIYLLSNNRPIAELINPNRLNMRVLYDNEFKGMSLQPVSYLDLEQIREDLIQQLKERLTTDEREFLITFKSEDPDWQLLSVKDGMKFPAIQWKLQNIRKMEPQKREWAINELKKKLDL